MGVVIDEVQAEVENSPSSPEALQGASGESTGSSESESDMTLGDRMARLEKRQQRLLAD